MLFALREEDWRYIFAVDKSSYGGCGRGTFTAVGIFKMPLSLFIFPSVSRDHGLCLHFKDMIRFTSSGNRERMQVFSLRVLECIYIYHQKSRIIIVNIFLPFHKYRTISFPISWSFIMCTGILRRIDEVRWIVKINGLWIASRVAFMVL